MTIESLLVSLTTSWIKIFPLFLNLIAALLLILIGYLLAKLFQKVITTILKSIQLDKGCRSLGLTAYLEKADIRRTPAELLGDMVYWLTILVLATTVAMLVGFGADQMIGKFFIYMGIVLMASLILGIGFFFASFIADLVLVIATNIGIERPRIIVNLVRYVVIIAAIVAAAEQLGLDVMQIIPSLDVVVGAFGLAFAIAVGLGCKDMAADWVRNFFKK